jgi:hypothetical protein
MSVGMPMLMPLAITVAMVMTMAMGMVMTVVVVVLGMTNAGPAFRSFQQWRSDLTRRLAIDPGLPRLTASTILTHT